MEGFADLCGWRNERTGSRQAAPDRDGELEKTPVTYVSQAKGCPRHRSCIHPLTPSQQGALPEDGAAA